MSMIFCGIGAVILGVTGGNYTRFGIGSSMGFEIVDYFVAFLCCFNGSMSILFIIMIIYLN